MREIKFRAWNKVQRAMFFPAGLDLERESILRIDRNPFVVKLIDGWSKSDNFVLMQFTGLKDKNGVDIYEHDLLRYEGKSWQGDPDGFLVEVEWDAEHTMYVGRILDTSGAFNLSTQAADGRIGLYVWINKLEVIGNHFENPELLEGGSK